MRDSDKKTLLINYIYWPPVGHAIEALRFSLGYHIANPSFEISLVLNKHTAYELASLCPWIKQTYTVPVYPIDSENKASSITPELYSHIPQEWDYVVHEPRSKSEEWCPGVFFEYYQQTKNYFKARMGSGYCGDDLLKYSPNNQLLFDLPKENREYATKHLKKTKVKIALLLAGNNDPEFFPSIKSWEMIINALCTTYKDLSLYLCGKLQRGDDKSSISGISREDVDSLLTKYPNTVDCFDIGLFNQLAVIQGCDMFLSPHTGFGFAVLAAGTPWLTISGGRWAEYFYNGVPFYSVLADRRKYPVYEDPDYDKMIDDNGTMRIPSMSCKRIEEDLTEILKGADILINKKWTYGQCLVNHFEKMKSYYGDPKQIWSFDNIHTRFIK